MNYKDIELKIKHNPFKSLNDAVYEIIYENIIFLNIIPGDIISERKLAEDFSVSRTTVNNALKRLAMEGLVIISSRKPTIVSDISYDDFIKLITTRNSLEVAAAGDAVKKMSHEELNLLLHYGNELITDKKDLSHYIKCEDTFHSYIIECSKNHYLIEMYKLIKPAINRYRSLYFYYYCSEEYNSENKLLCEAFKERNSSIVKSAMNNHIYRLTKISKEKFNKSIEETIKLIKNNH